MRNNLKRFNTRKERVRNKIKKSLTYPRLSIFKSGRHIYAQLIDDKLQKTLASASTLEKDIKLSNKSLVNKYYANVVGSLIGERAKKIGVTKVVYDKGGYSYHGVLSELANSARKFLEF